MRYFVVFLFLFVSVSSFSQENNNVTKVTGTIINDNTLLPMSNVNIININLVNGTTTDNKGVFELNVRVNDTLHISYVGFQSIKVRVTNDWVKAKTTKIQLTEKAYALEEVVIKSHYLTGYLEVDTKLIPVAENYRFSISGLPQGYEAGEYSPNALSKVLGSVFNPADLLYNVFGKKPKELGKLKQMKKDDTVRNLLQTKFDRETLSVLLGLSKKDIEDVLERCNYSETFIRTANDLQIMDAISGCYEEYKILKRN